MAKHPVLDAYEALKKHGKQGFLTDGTSQAIDDIVGSSRELLSSLERLDLPSNVKGKTYFAFQGNDRLSGPVNQAIFEDSWAAWDDVRKAMKGGHPLDLDPEVITRGIYTGAMSFCAAVDVLKSRSNKIRGTFFEYFAGYFFTWRAGVEPTKSTPLQKLGEDSAELPTDFTFDLGKDRPKFHMPVKTSTRERSIMLWAHQKLLDGVYGIERFMGIPILLAETKKNSRTQEVVEICTPEQWRLYQTYIARLACIYYLDLPAAYVGLNEVFPRVPVRPFGAFFTDWEDFVGPG